MLMLGGEAELVQRLIVILSHETERRAESRWEGVRPGLAP